MSKEQQPVYVQQGYQQAPPVYSQVAYQQPPPQQQVYYQQPPPQVYVAGGGVPPAGTGGHHHHCGEDEPSCCPPAALEVFLAYIFPLIGGGIIISIERRSFYCVFHAWQALLMYLVYLIIDIPLQFLSYVVLAAFGYVSLGFSIVWAILALITLIIAMIRAKERKIFKWPILGHLAEHLASRRSYEETIYD